MDIGTVYLNGQILRALTTILMILVMALILSIVFSKRKSQSYRKHISDMYVAAKIRFFAKEDALDLVVEEKAFKNWVKKQNSEYKDVDESVMQELKERIEDSKEKPKK